MENQKTTTATSYHLPYESLEINSYILLAKNAALQAEDADTATNTGIKSYDHTAQEILPSLPADKNIYLSPIVLQAEAMTLCFDSAYKARSAESHSLNIAFGKEEARITAEQQKAAKLELEIERLTAEAERLRNDFTTATDTAIAADTSASTDRAKTLLTTLETTYERHNQLKNCKQTISEAEANLHFIRQKMDYCQEQLNRLAAEQPQVMDRLSSTRSYFDISLPTLPKEPNVMLDTEESMVITTKEENARPSAGALIWSYFKIILIALLLAFVIRAYVIDITQVDGTSMYPTLEHEDNIVTAKIAYILGEPQRGDIVVFDAPDSPGEDYIKRIIALPNEEVIIENGAIYIDGERLKEPYLDGVYTDGEIRTVVQDGCYFVMGDNRAVSHDSRVESVGCITIDAIHGKAILRLFPFSSFGGLYN